MMKLAFGAIAAALVAATAVPALAQVGVYAGPGGVGVDIGTPGYYYGHGPYYRGYYDHALRSGDDVTVYRRHGWHEHHDER